MQVDREDLARAPQSARQNIKAIPAAGDGELLGNSEILALLCPDWRTAMLAVDPQTMVVAYANSAALTMLRERHPLFVAGGVLGVNLPRGGKRLRAAFDHLLNSGHSEVSLVFDDPQKSSACGLRIKLPQGFLRQTLDRHLQMPGRLAVLDIATCPLPLSRADLHALAVAFELTAVESVILNHLVDGHSLHQIAEMRGVGTETVRHHCKRLLSKTRCRRQSELVRLVYTICGHELHDVAG